MIKAFGVYIFQRTIYYYRGFYDELIFAVVRQKIGT